jgi:hypothetical protein
MPVVIARCSKQVRLPRRGRGRRWGSFETQGFYRRGSPLRSFSRVFPFVRSLALGEYFGGGLVHFIIGVPLDAGVLVIPFGGGCWLYVVWSKVAAAHFIILSKVVFTSAAWGVSIIGSVFARPQGTNHPVR